MQRLVKLQQEVEEMKASTAHSDALMRKWESLATRAQNIPTVSTMQLVHIIQIYGSVFKVNFVLHLLKVFFSSM